MSSPDRWLLPSAVARRIFTFEIMSGLALLRFSSAGRPPTAAITGGQPGAGKTRLMTRLRYRVAEELGSAPNNHEALLISGDDLREYHPKYRRLLREDPHNAAFYTDRDAGRWTEMLIDEASNRQLDLVIESTMRVPDTFRTTSSLLRSKDYAVEAHIVAVRPSLSWLGVHLRYETAIRLAGHGRFTIRASHDAAMAGLPTTLAAILDERLATSISIWERGGVNPTFTTEFQDGNWSISERPDDWLQAFWARPPTPEDFQDIERGWALVLDIMRARGAPTGDLSKAQAEADRAISSLS
jgi:hypothetical protein